MSCALDVRQWRPGMAPAAPPDRVPVRSCIGCVAIRTTHECTGACDDRPIELVPAAAHDAVLELVEHERASIEALTPLVRRVAARTPADAEPAAIYGDLRAAARTALRRPEVAAPTAGAAPEVIEAWWCATCDRIEAPQPCLGICVHEPGELVRVEEHERVAAEAAALRRSANALRAVAHQLAWSTPREDGWHASLQALARRATAALAIR